jgi:glycosidase
MGGPKQSRARGIGLELGLIVMVVVACGPAHRLPVDPDGGAGADGGIGPGTADAAPSDARAGDSGAPSDQGERACTTRFGYRPPIGQAPQVVQVAGGWDWTARTALADADGDGEWTADLALGPGTWPYKLIVDGTWILDPARPTRAYDGTIENSAVTVETCLIPRLEVVSFTTAPTSATAVIRVVRASGGPSLGADQITATRRFEFQTHPAQVALVGDLATIELTGLGPGKYSLAVAATDDAGHAATPLHLPFWIEATPFDWRGPLYMIMLDRFRNGDPQNDPPPSPAAAAGADFRGGDLRGVASAISDGTLDELGITTIWVSPWIRNVAGVESDGGRGVSAFHGYWPTRGREIDPRFGSEADLEALVVAAHRRGIRVLMDYVINHVHEEHEYFAAHPTWFRTGCECGTTGCDWTAHRLDCSFRSYMPDVDWQDPAGGARVVDDALWWLERFDLDGLRVDAVKHVEDLAIYNLAAAVHERLEGAGTEVFLLGETAMGWNGDSLPANSGEYATISRYIGKDALSGQFDFVLYHGVSYRVWASEERGLLHADYWTKQSLMQYPAGAIMTPFVGSHDSSRFLSLAEAHGQSDLPSHKWVDQGLPSQPQSDAPYLRTALAYQWLLALPGAPLVYYGDEYGEFGGADPDNRHLWRGPNARSPREAALAAKIGRMGRARRDLRALRQGGYRTLLAEETVLVFAREAQADVAVVVLNRSATPATRAVPVSGGISTLVDVLEPGSTPLPVTAGMVQITVPAMSAMVLVPAP